MNLIKILAFEEGFRSRPYVCSMGYVTIGLGTKLHKHRDLDPNDFPISVTRAQAEVWLDTEVEAKHSGLLRRSTTYKNLDSDRQAILLSMAYQMGVSGVLKFQLMLAALHNGDYNEAAAQALSSRWAEQTPERAMRHARVLRGESLDSVYGDKVG